MIQWEKKKQTVNHFSINETVNGLKEPSNQIKDDNNIESFARECMDPSCLVVHTSTQMCI